MFNSKFAPNQRIFTRYVWIKRAPVARLCLFFVCLVFFFSGARCYFLGWKTKFRPAYEKCSKKRKKKRKKDHHLSRVWSCQLLNYFSLLFFVFLSFLFLQKHDASLGVANMVTFMSFWFRNKTTEAMLRRTEPMKMRNIWRDEKGESNNLDILSGLSTVN